MTDLKTQRSKISIQILDLKLYPEVEYFGRIDTPSYQTFQSGGGEEPSGNAAEATEDALRCSPHQHDMGIF